MSESATDPFTAFRQVNSAGTLRLASMAARCGVQRLIYVSSIKVNGEQTDGRPFTGADPPCPEDPYAVSKWEAEQVLRSVAQNTDLEVVVLRPPLIYGKEVAANFLQLMRLISAGFPMPFARVQNRRSLLYVGNLADAIYACLSHPGAPGRTFLVSDGEDISTPELIQRLAKALGRPAKLFAIPPNLLHLLGRITGKSAQVDRLIGSLLIDGSEIRRELQWTPPFSMSQGLQETTNWYLTNKLSNSATATIGR